VDDLLVGGAVASDIRDSEEPQAGHIAGGLIAHRALTSETG